MNPKAFFRSRAVQMVGVEARLPADGLPRADAVMERGMLLTGIGLALGLLGSPTDGIQERVRGV